MIKMILESNLTKELKDKMLNLFKDTESHVTEHAQEAKNATVIYLPVELTFIEPSPT